MPVEQAAGANRAQRHASRSARPAGRGHRAVARARRRTTREEGRLRERIRGPGAARDRSRRRSGVAGLPEFHRADGQPLVDAAFLAQGLLRAPTRAARRARPDDDSGTSSPRSSRRGAITPGFNNWLLFSATVEAGARDARRAWDRMRVDYALRQHDQWYKGDGAYGDGPDVPLGLLQQLRHPSDAARRARRVRRRDAGVEGAVGARRAERAQRYAAVHERLIAPDGSFPPIGRSLAYRFGALQLLAQMALRRALPEGVSPAQVRGALTAVDPPVDRSARTRSTPTAGCGSGSAATSRASASATSRPAACICARSGCCRSGSPPADDVLVRAAAALDLGARVERPAVSDRSRALTPSQMRSSSGAIRRITF